MQSLRERAIGNTGQGWRIAAGVAGGDPCMPGSVHLSRVLSSARIRPLFTGDSRFPGRCIESADEKRVYYAIRLEVTRSEGGLPLSMNPMRGGGPAAVCTREHKADFQWFTSSHQTHTARIAVKTPSAAVFHSSARFSYPDRFHSCLAKVGETRIISRWNREHSANVALRLPNVIGVYVCVCAYSCVLDSINYFKSVIFLSICQNYKCLHLRK